MGTLKYGIQINNGVEAFGTTGKTITANEECDVAGYKELAEEMTHFSKLTDQESNEYVIKNLMKAIVHEMCRGKRVVLPIGNDNKAACAFHLDLHLANGNINEAKAAALGFNEITEQNAAEIVRKAGGVKIGVKIEVEEALLKAVKAKEVSTELTKVTDKPMVARVNGSGSQGGNNGGNNGGGGNSEEIG